MLKNKYILISWAILIMVFLSFCKREPQVKVINKSEFYVVLDTSGSMASGPFKHVQTKFGELLTLVKTGDSIYLIIFDVEPRLAKEIKDYDLTQKEELLNTINRLKPAGQFTDFLSLMDYLKNLVSKSNLEEEIYDKEKNEILKIQKKQYIIVLTDGKDEPPKKRKQLKIEDYSQPDVLPIKDRYVYYINFTDKKSEQLEKDLKKLSPNVKTISRPINHDVSDNTNKESSTDAKIKDPSGMEELKEDIEKQNRKIENENFFLTIFYHIQNIINNYKYYIILLLVLLLLIGFLLFYKFKPEPMKGELTFYEVGMHPSMGKTIKLSRFERKKLTIGNDPSCLIRIKTKDFPNKVKIKALDKKDDYFFKIPRKYLKDIQLLTSDKTEIRSGDKFKIKNYIFEYNYGSKYKKY
jgi:hypothetical protein